MMRVALFCHSLLSDWNHGNAHFLRGVVTELQARGHGVRVYEPSDAWSVRNHEADHGALPLAELARSYPSLEVTRYDRQRLDLDQALEHVELVLVHEWNDPALVADIGRHHARHGHYTLLFHDTHHRSVSDPAAMRRDDLSAYDGVLAFGEAVRAVYVRAGWGRRVWTWHQAADVRVFFPRASNRVEGDLVWIGNWGDDERAEELTEFLLEPARALALRARLHGARYPEHARAALAAAGVEYAGWLPNFRAPEVYSRFRATVHVPRRFYVKSLRGVPTIRLFEALACGIPLVCSPWDDCEGLFRAGTDYLLARDGEAMKRKLRAVLSDTALATTLARNGRERIIARHTCAHRVDELLAIHRGLQAEAAPRREVA